MAFFEDLAKKLNFAVGETASKTKEIASVTKLNTSISARQHEIEDAYTEIGKALFEREAADPESPVAALCAKILANQECIHEMKQTIVELKNETIENRKARAEALFGTPAEPEAVEPEPTEPVATESEPAESEPEAAETPVENDAAAPAEPEAAADEKPADPQ